MFFFFQAEDGIRDLTVTGVQTCALPICRNLACVPACVGAETCGESGTCIPYPRQINVGEVNIRGLTRATAKIGRASCRERVEIAVVAVRLKNKREQLANSHDGCRTMRSE